MFYTNEYWTPVRIDDLSYPYLVSSYGRVMNKKGRIMKPWMRGSKGGRYPAIGLCRNSVIKKIDLHRLVALHFIDNPYNKPEVNHKDKNRLNPHISNLEWVTPKENVYHRDAFKTGEKQWIPIMN